MKDNFSIQSDKYARYRPAYPAAFFEYLQTIITGFDNAWDCGTGNGQVAEKLARFFKAVYATDISQKQLDNAIQLPNIYYSLQPAEQTNFKENFFDLVIVAQAVHWFNFEKFYAEVNRTAKNNAWIVILGYGKLSISHGLDTILDRFYHDIVGEYWDKERKYVDEHYQTIPFPFEEIKTPVFRNDYEWALDHVTGYLETWSAVNHYKKQNGTNPLDLIYSDLKAEWGETDKKIVRFPLLLRIGRIKKG